MILVIIIQDYNCVYISCYVGNGHAHHAQIQLWNEKFKEYVSFAYSHHTQIQ